MLQQKVQIPLENERTAPVESFVKLEHYNAIQLVQNVHVTLASLAKVIKGNRNVFIEQLINHCEIQVCQKRLQADFS